MKKFFTYPVFLVLFLSFIGVMGFGAILKYHYDGGEKFEFLREKAILISSVPLTIKKMISGRTLNPNKIENIIKHKGKKRVERFIENKRNALLVLPRYDHDLSRSVVDIIDFNNFEVIHTYKHNIDEMNDQVTNLEEFPRLKIDDTPLRFHYQHPLILDDGSLINIDGPAFKIDFCSNLQWINDEEYFHHSQMLDHEGNIWSPGIFNPYPEYIKRYINFVDDSLIKFNTDGEIIFNKSVTELLIDNQILEVNSFRVKNKDPIHLNDIEPAFSDTEYWRKGDVFLSSRHQSSIIHYRPNTNKVINYIVGPFSEQHDVDIISNKEISIFNNKNFLGNKKHSEILIYNFETKEFKKLFSDQLKKENFKTDTQGLSHIFKDGSLMVEEQNHGRLILFNNKGEKELEFVNKNKNGKIGYINWSRVIENELFIEKFKSIVNNKKC